MAWAEDPPSRTRHMISNIEVEAGDTKSRDQGLFQFHRVS
jgi:3-phenylpropionate/cinnamic acid dioxygenase small subunit